MTRCFYSGRVAHYGYHTVIIWGRVRTRVSNDVEWCMYEEGEVLSAQIASDRYRFRVCGMDIYI